MKSQFCERKQNRFYNMFQRILRQREEKEEICSLLFNVIFLFQVQTN